MLLNVVNFLTCFWFVLLGFVRAHPSKPNNMKTKDTKGGVDCVEAVKDATGEKGSKGTKRK